MGSPLSCLLQVSVIAESCANTEADHRLVMADFVKTQNASSAHHAETLLSFEHPSHTSRHHLRIQKDTFYTSKPTFNTSFAGPNSPFLIQSQGRAML